MTKISFDYLNAASKMVEKGDYESALHYYFLRRNEHTDDDIDVYIADVYAAMGMMQEATRFYMRAYSQNQDNEDAIKGLIHSLEEVDGAAAFYYLHCVLKKDFEEFGDVQMDEIENLTWDEFYESATPLTVHDRRDKSKLLDEAFKLLESGETDKAKEFLEAINEDSYQYADSMLARASIEMDRSNVSEAMNLADEALRVNPKHLGSHILKIMGYAALGDKESSWQWVLKLDALDAKSEDDVVKVALCLCNYNYYELAQKYVERKLKFTPYDKFMLMCLSSIYVSKGDMPKAYRVANKVCTLYPEDIEVKEITSLILSGKELIVPKALYELKREWAEKIKKIFLEHGDFTSPQSLKLIKWLFQNEDFLYLQSAVCASVTGMPEFDKIVDDLLIDPYTPNIVKKQIIFRRICDEKTTRIQFVVSNLFRSVKVSHPDAPDNLKYAYYYAFVALAVMELDSGDRLEKALKSLAKKYEQCQSEKKKEIPMGILATRLLYAVMGGDIKECLEVFDCSEAEYKEAGELLGF